MTQNAVASVILAAGKGTRMKSELPKVLHPVCGRPMLDHVLGEVQGASGGGKVYVVVGHKGELVAGHVGERAVCVTQAQQLGTGHAVMMAEPHLEGFDGDVLVTCGDTPLIMAETYRRMLERRHEKGYAGIVLTALLDNPTGYGRIVRGTDGTVCKIVEQRDCTPEEAAVREINAGTYCFSGRLLFDALKRVGNKNSQGEYYLTDVIEILIGDGHEIEGVQCHDWTEMLGVNSRKQLAEAGGYMRTRILDGLMVGGVTIVDPGSVWVEAGVSVGRETVLEPGVVLRRGTTIGEGCRIGPNSELIGATVGDGAVIRHSVVEGVTVEAGATVGPFAHVK